MYRQVSGNKFHARKTDFDGIKYDSKFEASYAAELALRIKARDIAGWRRQVRIPLVVNDEHIADYWIDFILQHNDGSEEYVECKGFETRDWKLKFKILEAMLKNDPTKRLTVVKQNRRWFR